MKIGFSLGRCVRDIVIGKVDIKEVVVIIAQTRIMNVDDLNAVIDGYLERTGYLKGLDAEKCHAAADWLWNSCRIHQPRRLAPSYSYGVSVPDTQVWKDVVDCEQ